MTGKPLTALPEFSWSVTRGELTATCISRKVIAVFGVIQVPSLGAEPDTRNSSAAKILSGDLTMKLKIAIAAAVLAVALAPFRGFAQSQAPAAIPGVLPAFITAGRIDPNGKVPALNAVPGAGVSHLDLSFPQTILTQGTSYWYLVALNDYNFTGTCVVSFKLTQVQSGKTVTLDSGTVKSFSCSANTAWAWAAVGNPIPNSPGIAKMTGSVKYGTATASVKTTVLLQ
jgi:hypothetical protein